VPPAHAKRFREFVHDEVYQALAVSPALSQKQFVALDARAKAAAAALTAEAARLASSPALRHTTPAPPTAAAATLSAPSTATARAGTAAPAAAAAAGKVKELTLTGPPRAGTPAATMSATAAAAAAATATGSKDIANAVLSDMRAGDSSVPVPDYFYKHDRQLAMRDDCIAHFAAHQVCCICPLLTPPPLPLPQLHPHHHTQTHSAMQHAAAKEALVDRAFVAVSVSAAGRASALENGKVVASRARAVANAAEMRARIAANQAAAKAEHQARLADEAALLARLKAELDAELAHAAHLQATERAGLAASLEEYKAECVVREEARKQAVRDALRAQKEGMAADAAKETARREKRAGVRCCCCTANLRYRYGTTITQPLTQRPNKRRLRRSRTRWPRCCWMPPRQSGQSRRAWYVTAREEAVSKR